MKKLNLKNMITMGLIATSLIAVTPMKANAEWKQDNIGWWYTEGNSYATGWRNISGQWYYFENGGYMQRNNWVYDDNDYTTKYYMNDDGTIRKDPISIYGITYTFDNNGRCIGEASNFKFIDNSTLEYRGKIYNYEKDNIEKTDDENIDAFGVKREKDPFISYKYTISLPGTSGPGSRHTLYVKDGKVLEGEIQLDNGNWYYIEGTLRYGWTEVKGRLKYYDWIDGHQIYGDNVQINGKTYSMSKNGLDWTFWKETTPIQKGYDYDYVVEKIPDWDLYIACGINERK